MLIFEEMTGMGVFCAENIQKIEVRMKKYIKF